MEVRFAGLRFVIGAILRPYFTWNGVSVANFSLVLLALTFTREISIKNGKKGLCLRLDLGNIWMDSFDGTPLIQGFIEKL
jgi:hypothetical protein